MTNEYDVRRAMQLRTLLSGESVRTMWREWRLRETASEYEAARAHSILLYEQAIAAINAEECADINTIVSKNGKCVL